MKRKALALTVILALFISLVIGVQSAKSSSKTIVVPDDYPTIQAAVDNASANLNSSAYGLTVISPSNTTYSMGDPIVFSFSGRWFEPGIPVTISYSLDGQSTVQVPAEGTFVPVTYNVTDANGTSTTAPSSFYGYYLVNATVPLPSMSEGQHSLTVWAYSKSSLMTYLESQETVSFTVTPTPTPSPEPSPIQEPFPTDLVIASVAGVAVGTVGLIVYFRKRSNARTNKHSETAQYPS
jgi:hypothetical protein